MTQYEWLCNKGMANVPTLKASATGGTIPGAEIVRAADSRASSTSSASSTRRYVSSQRHLPLGTLRSLQLLELTRNRATSSNSLGWKTIGKL